MDKIHIVAVSNDRYARYTAVMFNSLLENTSSAVDLYIIGNLSKDNQQKLNQSVHRFGVTITFFPVSESTFQGFRTYSYFTKEAYYRLLIPMLLDENINRAVYLDSDIIVHQDIKDLWISDLKDKYLGAVQDVGRCARRSRKRLLSIPKSCGYFNSGMMLLDLRKWREHNLADKVIDYARNNPQKLKSIDQDALNAVLCQHWKSLDPKWNYITARIRKRKYINKPAIIHYTGKKKPWNHYHPLKSIYMKYYQITLWND